MQAISSDWQAYTWKNELHLQSRRVLQHVREALDDGFSGAHSPLDMLERALSLSAFCIRRMVEKRLVTDAFAASQILVRTFAVRRDERVRPVFHRSSGGSFDNYDFETPIMEPLKPRAVADEIIHSSQLMVLRGDAGIADGILIVSDWHLAKRIIHFALSEFETLVHAVLADEVRATSDRWDAVSGKVTSTRE